MNLFSRRKATSADAEPTLVSMVADLQARLSSCESQMRTLEAEQATMHDQVRKWMRRAVAAERRAEERNQDPAGLPQEAMRFDGAEPPAPRRRSQWGARARIAARRARGSASANGNGSGAESAEEE